MQADFLDAHARHWGDAESLLDKQRWANADHLYGMAAECGLKRLMMAFGMATEPATGSPALQADWQHANSIWARFESYRCGHHRGAGYALPSVNPFQDWHVKQRYAHQSNFNELRAQSHRQGARQICELIKKAQTEGLI